METKEEKKDWGDNKNIQSIQLKKGDVIIQKISKDKEIKYKVGKLLGKGGFSKCYEVKTEDEKIYACKIVSKKLFKSEEENDKERNIENILAEINIQKELDFSKIVKIITNFEDDNYVYIILEKCRCTLATILNGRSFNEGEHKVNGTLSEIEVIYFIFQLIQGLQYLQKKNIIHCDLKPQNLFIDDNLELKIADFGLVRKEKDDDNKKDRGFGTIYYMSPEMVDPEIGKLTNKVDIWALGVIMYFLLTGKFPFKKEEFKEISKNKDYIIEIEFPEDKIISDEAKDLIKQILVLNPEKRPNLSQILYHDFFHIDKLQEKISYLKQLNIDDIIKNKTNIEIIRNTNKNKKDINKENKFPCLKKLKINQIIEIKLQDIDTYVLKEQSENEIFPNQISYFHKSIHYGFYYYEENNGFIGVKYKDGDTHLLVDNENEYFYNIIIDDPDTEKIKIEKYRICDCPEKLKSRLDELTKYNDSRKKKNKNKNGENNCLINQELVENNDKKDSKGEINNKKIFYIKEIKSLDKAYFLKLSDDTKQIKFYDDKSEIIMSDQKDSIIYQDRHKERSIIPIYNIMDNSSEEVISRIKYIRKKTLQEMNEKMRKKFEKLIIIRKDKNNEDIFNLLK